MIDIGSGPPLVLIPGIQGRWEWMQPTIDALAKQWRVVASSLPGEPGSGAESGEDDAGDFFVRHVDSVLDSAGVQSAVLCGVSFGGLIALRYAARRRDRVRALILVSAPGPRWKPRPRLVRYMRWPTLSSPLFFFGAVGRFWPELCVTYPDARRRLSFCATALSRVMAAPAIPSRMSRRARLAAAETFERDCASVMVPTLVVAGERELDQVVKHEETMDYLSLIEGARFELFEKTGHLGIVSAPERFAAIVSKFASNGAGL
jgi:pimeloyl-ACP methyl ester carboxylesterase